MDRGHQPVLLEEAIAALMVSADGMYVDGTFGRGGHSARILDALSPQGALLALDQDPTAAQRPSSWSRRILDFNSLRSIFALWASALRPALCKVCCWTWVSRRLSSITPPGVSVLLTMVRWTCG